MLPALTVLFLLAAPAPARAWSRPLWYQVGLDLQPWGCQPNGMEGCGRSLSCPGYWMGLGTNNIYPVAGVTASTTLMLLVGRALRRRRLQTLKGQDAPVTAGTCGPWKRRTQISDRALLLGVLHMLDALLAHIESHLQRLATQQHIRIKGTPSQSG
ncbi:transmembrane protein 89 [Tupaia chinensis]|uniref:Transmembrane protein 89 n=1 Tax=Tupaia chinensis TaxID=246437 RepID=L8Y018_TUPCH|nr:transmembrane protein 89 [Tupaia chinensis]ELV09663.1 Transmembrane protein 89 [Tupaia chinensis]